MKLTHSRVSLLAIAALVSVGTEASAFVSPQNAEGLEIQLPEFETRNYMDAQVAQGMIQTQQALAGDLGGRWKVRSWNTYAGSPHSVFGSGAAVASPLASALDAEAAARTVLEANASALRLDPDALTVTDVANGLGKYSVHFKQTYEGLDVIGGRAHTVFMDSGRLFVMGSDFFQVGELDATPTLSELDAEQIAAADVPFNPVTDQIQEGTDLVVLPYPVAVDQVEYHLVYRLRVETADPIAIWVTHVDAHSGEILWRYNDVHYFSGNTQGDIQQDTYCNGESSDPFAYMEVSVSGQGTTNSDANGNWSIGAGSGSATVTSQFFGPYCNVNRSSGGSDAQFSGTADGGTPFTIDWNDGNSRQDERDVFEGVTDVHEFIGSFDPTFAYINQRMTANVGVTGTCNAFWNGTINFYNAGGGCANTGEIQGVVHHEFGHGVQASILGTQGNEGLGEGNSDILANFITDESVIGRGFNTGNCVTGIRDSDNALQYPEDLTGQVHADGEIMAGVVWDVRKNLEITLGAGPGEFRAAQLWHFGRTLEHPFNQADQVFSMFIADDDNGDLSDGTPNYAAICAAAQKHDTNGNGYDCPTLTDFVTIAHAALTTPQSEGALDFVCDVTTTSGTIDDVTLHYTRNGLEGQATLTATGNPNEFSTTVPFSQGDQVTYFLTASSTTGNVGTAPEFAPFFVHAFDLTSEFDPMETDMGWSVNDEGTDDATTGVWTRVDPNGTAAQPEDDHTVDGTQCWVTGQGAVNGGIGDNDVDNGTTTLYSPGYDLSAYENVIVKYHRWYSNTGGNDPGNDLWVVQARNDGGAWVDVENNQTDQGRWLPVIVDVVDLFGTPGTVEFRFLASDLNDGSIVEAAVDDFEVLAVGDNPSDAPVISGAPLSFALYGASPNPASNGTTVSFQVPTNTKVSVSIFDVAGRKVRTLAADTFEAGRHQIAWDQKDDRGNDALSGVYYVRMQSNEFTASRSVVVSR
ncbi:MAG: FlgD immunoglobulin-like domain containing protein [Candidatus Eisenbacteria bacterium]